MTKTSRMMAIASVCVLAAQVAFAAAPDSELRTIYKELVETNTTHSAGSTTAAAALVAKRLRAAGFKAGDMQIVGDKRDKMNFVARLRGSGTLRPLLLLAHLDVVEARRADWSMDPFKLQETDGYFYGRGTLDDKAMVAIFTEIMLRLKRQGGKPNRDVILALTADEEGGPDNGVEWLLAHRRDLVDAALVLNEGGGGRIRGEHYLMNGVQASEKAYMNFELEVRNAGGHSSLPTKDNAIYRLATALLHLEKYQFPVELNDVTRNYLTHMVPTESATMASDLAAVLGDPPDTAALDRLSDIPSYNALLRTTCVATRLEGGHADNALPQSAKALINCRILPGHATAEIQSALSQAISDDAVSIKPTEKDTAGLASPLDPELMSLIGKTTEELWPGVPTAATMSSGATDSRYFRQAGIPAYGVSGIFVDMDDMRAHGRDERLGVKQFEEGSEFLWRLVTALTH